MKNIKSYKINNIYYMKNIKSYKIFESVRSKIEEIIKFINPSNPIMSDEYYYYIWGDDEVYNNANKFKTSDYISVIKDTVFKSDSNTSKKFGYDFMMANKEEILQKCKEEIEGIEKDKKSVSKSRKDKNRIKNNKNRLH